MLLTDVAVAAVRPICPEAVATLLAWLSASDPTVRRHAKILVEWRLHLPVRVPTNQESGYGQFTVSGPWAPQPGPRCSPSSLSRSIRPTNGRGAMRLTR
jgi:hypothetical protein